MLSPESRIQLKSLLVRHEEYRQYPYLDTKGNVTIGIGYNLSARGLPEFWINQQYENDVEFFYNSLKNDFPWFKNLNEARQIVLIDMSFMGYQKFKTFKKMLYALAHNDYKLAAQEMIDSKWAAQVGNRAHELAAIMIMGEIK